MAQIAQTAQTQAAARTSENTSHIGSLCNQQCGPLCNQQRNPPRDPSHDSQHNALRDCLAPAKLNLFLHITGRRPDGYHALQTVFQLLDWGDTLHFARRDDGRITRKTAVPGVPDAHDLSVRAATLLKQHTGTTAGVEIDIEKRLPMGAGLGGGSSDAATTLLALNRLWELDLPRATLQALALQLGADVPFFVFGKNAFAEGVGEALQAVSLPRRYFLVVTPPVHVPTAAVFSEKSLTRNTKPITITDFLAQQGREGHHEGGQKSGVTVGGVAGWPDCFGSNDMQPVVAEKYAEVARALQWLDQIVAGVTTRAAGSVTPAARMTGSGASVFAAFGSLSSARAAQCAAQARLPDGWRCALAASLEAHPLLAFAA